jgi:ATP-binding cassette, subfamily B, bacterial
MKQIVQILLSVRSLWRSYIAIGLFTVVVSIMTLLLPLLSGMAIDELTQGENARIWYVVGIAFLIFLLDFMQNIFSNIGGYVGDIMAARLRQTLSSRYYQHLLSLPQAYFNRELSGKIINRLNRSIVQIANFMQMMSNNFLQFIFTTIFSLVIIALYSWQVALLLGLLYPIYVVMTIKTSPKWQQYQQQINQHADIATGRFSEAINQIKVVKSYLQEKRELKSFTHHIQKTTKLTRPQSRHWHTKDFQRRFVLNIIFFLVYVFIFTQAVNGQFSAGAAVALILYAMQIRIPIFTISFLVENMQRAISDSKDYFEVMSEQPAIHDIAGAKPLVAQGGHIVFDKVSFSYDDSEPVLKNISFEIEAGSKVAFVGESGEGKTTLTNLLMRLYEPEKGKIYIDRQDIALVTQSSLRSHISFVFQDPSLFSGTIKENIAYANPAATDDEISRAARQANAYDFIKKLKNGFDTEIGERGLRLSGGQKQRIAIARAFLKNSQILVLDEATSSLDSKSEALVQDAIEALMANRTTIIIAHRLSTVQHVDTIITLKKGRVDEVGSPLKLSKTNGIYAQLLRLQQGKSDKDMQKLKQYEILK